MSDPISAGDLVFYYDLDPVRCKWGIVCGFYADRWGRMFRIFWSSPTPPHHVGEKTVRSWRDAAREKFEEIEP